MDPLFIDLVWTTYLLVLHARCFLHVRRCHVVASPPTIVVVGVVGGGSWTCQDTVVRYHRQRRFHPFATFQRHRQIFHDVVPFPVVE